MHYPPHKHMFENPCPFSRCVISKHMFLEYSTDLIYYTCKRTFRSISDSKIKLCVSKETIIRLFINTSKYTILKYYIDMILCGYDLCLFIQLQFELSTFKHWIKSWHEL